MDLFYKPPLQRADECSALEENYMNCLLQKAMRDKVLTNRCVMDSILWFHLECPKAAAKFDDPNEFKRKFRDFFAETRTAANNVSYISDEARRIRDEYNHVSYPEDVRAHKEVRLFQDTFKEFSPVRRPEPEEDYETDDISSPFDTVNKKQSTYGRKSDLFKTVPLSRDEDKRGQWNKSFSLIWDSASYTHILSIFSCFLSSLWLTLTLHGMQQSKQLTLHLFNS